MAFDRRAFIGCVAAATALVFDKADAAPSGRDRLYGLISEFLVLPERRDEFIAILAASTKDMPGCRSYVIAKDVSRNDAVWITEVWTDSESHAAALKLPVVQEAMRRGRPLITGIGSRIATHPVAGA